MAAQLAHQHQPVRVIRSAGSTSTDRPAQPRLTGRQPRPARRPRKSPPQHPAIGRQIRANQPPATQPPGGTTGPWAAATQRSPPRADLPWCLAGLSIGWPTRSVAPKPQYPGIRTSSPARDRSNRSGCVRCPTARSSLGGYRAFLDPRTVTLCNELPARALYVPAICPAATSRSCAGSFGGARRRARARSWSPVRRRWCARACASRRSPRWRRHGAQERGAPASAAACLLEARGRWPEVRAPHVAAPKPVWS